MVNLKKWSIGPIGFLLSAAFFVVVGMLLNSGWTDIMSRSAPREFQLDEGSGKQQADLQPKSKISKLKSLLSRQGVQPSKGESQILDQVEREAREVGKLQLNPNSTLQRLKKLATQLEFPEMKRLKSVVIDPKANGDKRMMSVFLLSQVGKIEVATLLKEIASHPIAQELKGTGLLEEELVVRAQAIEGLVKFKANESVRKMIQQLENSLEYSFLNERLRSSLKE